MLLNVSESAFPDFALFNKYTGDGENKCRSRDGLFSGAGFRLLRNFSGNVRYRTKQVNLSMIS